MSTPMVQPSVFARTLDTLLETSTKLMETYQLDDLAGQMKELSRMPEDGFRLAFIGESTDGKSTIINRLIGREILATQTHRHRPVLIRLRYGEAEGMHVRFPDSDEIMDRVVSEESWTDIMDDPTPGIANLCEVWITVNDPWLKEFRIELIEAPAISMNPEETAWVSDLLDSCHGMLFVLNAITPLSLTQKTLFETQVVQRHIGAALVVVSHLDLYVSSDQQALLKRTNQRVHAVAPDVEVVPSDSAGEAGEGDGIHYLKSKLEAMTSLPARKAERGRRVMARLSDVLLRAINLAQQALTNQQLTSEQLLIEEEKRITVDRQLNLALDEISAKAELWKLHTRKSAAQILHEVREQVAKRFHPEILAAADVEAWWNQNVYSVFREQWQLSSQRLKEKLTQGIEDDYSFMVETVNKAGAVTLANGKSGSWDLPELVPHFSAAVASHEHLLRWAAQFTGQAGPTVVSAVGVGIKKRAQNAAQAVGNTSKSTVAPPVASDGSSGSKIGNSQSSEPSSATKVPQPVDRQEPSLATGLINVSKPALSGDWGMVIAQAAIYILPSILNHFGDRQKQTQVNRTIQAVDNDLKTFFQDYEKRVGEVIDATYDDMVRTIRNAADGWRKDQKIIHQPASKMDQLNWKELISQAESLRQRLQSDARLSAH